MRLFLPLVSPPFRVGPGRRAPCIKQVGGPAAPYFMGRGPIQKRGSERQSTGRNRRAQQGKKQPKLSVNKDFRYIFATSSIKKSIKVNFFLFQVKIYMLDAAQNLRAFKKLRHEF